MKKNILSNFWEKRSIKQQVILAVTGILLYMLILFFICYFVGFKISFKDACGFAGIGYVATTVIVQFIMLSITDDWEKLSYW
ncbi:MAG: hypothetical protein QG674_293 [Patescibacteria group bacterium]|jgi:hypothetical protein|nr:hypothetical protein [Patescibacteria group bacterium]